MNDSNYLYKVDRYEYLILSIIILGFIISKIPYLDYPFYWDEAWVYAPAVQYLAENGPSLFPWSLPVELGRGHPLLFHFLGSIWVSLFGDSLISLHSYPLFISCMLLIAIYYFVRSLSRPVIALSAVLVFCCLHVFFVQSVFVLPEILFALFALLSVRGFIDRNDWLLGISGSLMLLTKESGLAIIGTLFLLELMYIIRDREKIVSHLTTASVILATTLPFLLFLWIQYQTYGWIFYPEHTGYLDLNFRNILILIHDLAPGIFSDRGLIVLNLSSLIFLLLWAFQNNKNTVIKGIAIINSALFILLFLSRDVFGSDDIIRVLLGLFILLTIVLFLFVKKQKAPTQIERFYWSSIAVIFGFVIYTSMNFFSYRYLLVIFPFIIMLPFISFHQLAIPNKYLIIPLLLILMSLVPYLSSSGKFGDTDPSYINMLKAYQEMTSFVTENIPNNTPIQANFLPMTSLSDYRAGYLEREEEYDKFVWDGSHKYLISVNGEFSEMGDREDHILMKEINVEKAKIRIYQRTN